MTKVTVILEVTSRDEIHEGSPLADTLHEDLCRAIHELDLEALKRLKAYVTDIILAVPVDHRR